MSEIQVQRKNIETTLIHGGIYGDVHTGAVNVPIYQTSTYEQKGLGETYGWEYSRTGNPTRAALEALIADLEEGTAGFAFASGMAAISTVLSLFSQGDKIIISGNVYGGTYRVLDKVFQNFGITYSIEDTTDLKTLEQQFTDEVKAILIETPANPLLTITDIAGVARIAKWHGALTIVDNTFMSPHSCPSRKLYAGCITRDCPRHKGMRSTDSRRKTVEQCCLLN